MRKIVIIDGHPDPSRKHLNHVLADRYAETASSAGNEVRRVNVAELDFVMLRSQADFERGTPPLDIERAQRDIKWADHLVFFFPLWHGSMPALLKAFIEQTFRPGFAMAYNAKGFPKGLLGQKSARIIVTMGMPAFIYRTYFGAHGVKALDRSTLRFAGIHPIHTTLFGGVGDVAEAKAKRWIAKVESLAIRDSPTRTRDGLDCATSALQSDRTRVRRSWHHRSDRSGADRRPTCQVDPMSRP